MAQVTTYVVPEVVMTSKSKEVRGWEVVERGRWIVHASSRDSPEAARRKVTEKARWVGANALVEFDYLS